MTHGSRNDCWYQLAEHFRQMKLNKVGLKQLFEDDPQRVESFSVQAGQLHLDYSKNLLSRKSRDLLLELASQADLQQAIARLFDGEAVNNTENRPALHMALRGHEPPRHPEIPEQVSGTLQRMAEFVDAVHQQRWRGYDEQPIKDVVNIGIGGSDLGPAMATEALRHWHRPGLHCHFVSNIDPVHMHNTLHRLNPGTTLFLIASKSFGTLETLKNAEMAKRWYLDNGGTEAGLARHFAAVSSNIAKAEQFGIDQRNIFPLWDWVGGRYSLWSAIGLPIAMATGMDTFRQLLAGAHEMDEHFRSAPLAQNMPVIMGLINMAYGSFLEARSQVVLPYSQSLVLFPAFLQQLEMESLGKSTSLHGEPVRTHTGLVIWGSAGTNGQHSFHQLLHQGTQFVPADFIAVARCQRAEHEDQHRHLLANCFSQSQALMQGVSVEQVVEQLVASGMAEAEARALAPHKQINGNKPSNTLLLPQLSPHTLGSLIALYEHRVYVQSVLWQINAFDQWGVELGKQLSEKTCRALAGDPGIRLDASSSDLIRRCRQLAAVNDRQAGISSE